MNTAFVSRLMINVPDSEKTPFLMKLQKIADRLNTQMAWILAVMYRESGVRSDSHYDVDGIPIGGGLIGFMRSTLKDSRYGGITLEQLLSLSLIDQLDYVELFFRDYVNKLKSFDDVGLAVFYPYAIGQPDNYIVGSEQGWDYAAKVGKMNSGFDVNKDGYVSIDDYKKFNAHKFPELS